MKGILIAAASLLVSGTVYSSPAGQWQPSGEPYFGQDNYACSGNHHIYVFAEEQGGRDYIGNPCTVVGAEISLVIDAKQGYNCPAIRQYQDMKCVGTVPANPLDEFVDNQDTFTLDKLVIGPKSTEIVKIGTVDRPGSVLVYVRTDLDLIAKNTDQVGVNVLQTGSLGVPYYQSILPFNPDPKFFAMQVANAVIPSGFAETASGIWVNAARSPDGPSGLGLTGVHGQKISDPGFNNEAFKSGYVSMVRNYDSSGSNPGDDSLGAFFLLVQNESASKATLKNVSVTVKLRFD